MKIEYYVRRKRVSGEQVFCIWIEEKGKENLVNLAKAMGLGLSHSMELIGDGNIWAVESLFNKFIENAALLGYKLVAEGTDSED